MKIDKHLCDAEESYLQHFVCAAKMGMETLEISLILFTHAIFPFLFETTASQKIEKLNNKIQERRKRTNE